MIQSMNSEYSAAMGLVLFHLGFEEEIHKRKQETTEIKRSNSDFAIDQKDWTLNNLDKDL